VAILGLEVTIDTSNKVDIARFRLQSTTMCSDFTLEGLRNCGGRVHISLFWVQILLKKWQRRIKL